MAALTDSGTRFVEPDMHARAGKRTSERGASNAAFGFTFCHSEQF